MWVGVVLAIGTAAVASPDSDWADQQKLGDSEMGEFNRAFGAHATIAFDHHMTHWKSIHDMVMACNATTMADMCSHSIQTLINWGQRFKITSDGLKAITSVTCRDGDDDRIAIKGSTIDIQFKQCSVLPYANEQPAKALIAAFHDVLFEEANGDVKPMLDRFNSSCGAQAASAFDHKIDTDAITNAYGANVGDVCKNGLQYAAEACDHNPKIKAALAKVKTFTCTDAGKPAAWKFKLAGSEFTETLSAKPLGHGAINLALEQATGAKSAWTIPRVEVEGN
jgi:hypothetical protein